jgi:hypothetical protein
MTSFTVSGAGFLRMPSASRSPTIASNSPGKKWSMSVWTAASALFETTAQRMPRVRRCLKHGCDARIGAGLVHRVLAVVALEGDEDLLERAFIGVLRKAGAHEIADAIADGPPDLVLAPERKLIEAKRIVHCVIEVIERVEERPIEIEYRCCVCHGLPPWTCGLVWSQSLSTRKSTHLG